MYVYIYICLSVVVTCFFPVSVLIIDVLILHSKYESLQLRHRTVPEGCFTEVLMWRMSQASPSKCDLY